MNENRNIIFIILGSALVIVVLAFIGRWAMHRGAEVQTAATGVNAHASVLADTPSVPATGGNMTSSPAAQVCAPGTPRSTMVTQADADKTVILKAGTQFLLNLGDSEAWSVTVGDNTIIRQVPNASAAKGTQGLFEVLRTGSTTITAVGRPQCTAGRMCAQYVITFKTTILGV
ncbi:MAG TPA: hypothetical protein VF438_02515 [Candidatus Paceibacterota bacterium]